MSEDLDTIGVYRIDRQLGKGGMGEVFLGFDSRLGRTVAIKRIRHDAVANPNQQERLRREARIAATLNHPAIAQVYDIVIEDSGDAIVMEFVDGQTLATLLSTGKLPGSLALQVALQVTEGLSEAHGNDLVHRDLKAENVMVTPEGRAKILDFGLAKRLSQDTGDALTIDGGVLGTVSTMSPEQAAGQEVDPRSDLFSLGVLLYEAFTGHSPFRRENRLKSLQAVLRDDPPPPRALRPELPVELCGLIEKLLQKAPEYRPQKACDVTAALRQISELPDVDRLDTPTLSRGDASWSEARSDAPTASQTTFGPSEHSPAIPTLSGGPWPLRKPGLYLRARWTAAAVVLLASILWAAGAVRSRVDSHYVVVARPKMIGESTTEQVELVRVGVHEAALSSLHYLEGVVPIDRAGSEPARSESVDLGLTDAADEVLHSTVRFSQGTALVTFRRVDVKSRRILGNAGPFEVSTLGEDALELATVVRARLADAYPELGSRAGIPDLNVRDVDYRSYIGFKRRVDAGKSLGVDDLAILSELVASSPQFLEGYLLAAGIARDLDGHERALTFAQQAESLAPNDPRPLAQQFDIEMDRGDLEGAQAALEKLENEAHGTVLVLRAQARLLAQRGKLVQAIALGKRLIERRPSWRNYWYLTDFEMRNGDVDDSRGHLEEFLKVSPSNSAGLEKLAELELFFGEAERANTIYMDLIEANPRRKYHGNRGWVLYLLGHYEEAVDSYQAALEIHAGHVRTRFNLALAEQALGQVEPASERLTRLLADLAGTVKDEKAEDRMFRAQCLVRLGEHLDAVKIARQVVEQFPNSESRISLREATLRFQAAQVYALAGERHSALIHIESVLDFGLHARWFRIPVFSPLADDQDFEELLSRDHSTAAAR